jgi:hypothetical protein
MNTIYNSLRSFWNMTAPLITRGAYVYLSIVLLHYGAANLYPRMCTPLTVIGFIMSPFMVIAPHCEGLRWIIGFTGTQIRNMWLWIGGYLICYADGIIRDNITTKSDKQTNILDVNTDYPRTRSQIRSTNTDPHSD